ncbi:MAG: hypothetical protein R3A10_21010 [Caldilineaceae bacterium]
MDYYLPAGSDPLPDRRRVQGGGRRRSTDHFPSLPPLVRSNSAIVVGNEETWLNADYTTGFALRAYGMTDGGRFGNRHHRRGRRGGGPLHCGVTGRPSP